ncbi:MAG: glycosyltransferase family 9 protein [Verrucomicrobiota bacterium]
MRLLVIKPTALGDVAHALQVVPYLKAIGWCDHLAWVVDEDYAPLVESCPLVDQVIGFPRKRWRRKRPLSEIIGWAGKLRQQSFDLVLDLQGLARSALMTLASGCPKRIGLESSREGSRFVYTKRVNDTASHAIDRYAAACGNLVGACPLPQVYLETKPDRGLIKRFEGQPYTVIHAYSQRDEKLWPWRYVQELVERLPDERFVLVGQGSRFPCSGHHIYDLRNRTSLKELIPVIGGAQALISTDSGPLHIAAALGIPVLGIYGASLPERTRPRGKRAFYLWNPEFSHNLKRSILPAHVSAEAMESITPDFVVNRWRDLIKSS